MLRDKKGITLIALVVTIVCLLLLAGMTIVGITGDNGIIRKSLSSKEKNTHAKVYDAIILEVTNYENQFESGNINISLIDYLKKKNYISEGNTSGEYIININTLLDEEINLGKGTDKESDVYKIVAVNSKDIEGVSVNEQKYQITYCGKNSEEKADLGSITDVEQIEQKEDYGEYVATINYETFYNKLQDAVNAVTNGDETIYLLRDVKGGIEVSSDQNIKINLLGNTLDYVNHNDYRETIYNEGNLTIFNGTITSQNDSEYTIMNYGNLLIDGENTKIISNGYGCYAAAICNAEGAILNINGGTIISTSSYGIDAAGGEIYIKDVNINAYWDSIYCRNNAKLVILNGTFNETIYVSDGDVTINGGTFSTEYGYSICNYGDTTVKINGGTFNPNSFYGKVIDNR